MIDVITGLVNTIAGYLATNINEIAATLESLSSTIFA